MNHPTRIGRRILLAAVLGALVGSGAGAANADYASCTAGVTCYGTPRADTIDGSPGDDWILAGDGADLVQGHDGADVIQAEGMNDTVYGGAGSDSVYIDGGFYGLYGMAGSDVVEGKSGTDAVYGIKGEDWLRGGAGPSDIIVGWDDGFTTDHLDGGDGVDDRCYLSANIDVHDGGCEVFYYNYWT